MRSRVQPIYLYCRYRPLLRTNVTHLETRGVFCTKGPVRYSGIHSQPAIQIVQWKNNSASSNSRDAQRSYSSKPVVPFLLADIGEGITEVQILQWLVKEGDKVSEFDKIANVQSDKATVEITSPYDGVIVKLYGDVGGMIQVGKPLVDIQISNPDAVTGASNTVVKKPVVHEKSNGVLATPAVRALAKEMHISLNTVSPGSGENGRVLKQDLLSRDGVQTVSNHTEKPNATSETLGRHRVEMNVFQKSMVKSMEAAMKVPHFGYSERVIMDAAIGLRELMRSSVPKFSFMPLWIKAASVALKDFPILNASLVPGKDSSTLMIEYHDYHNISIAMDTQQGLAVPVIKHVDKKSIAQISAELDVLIEKGKRNALTRQDLANGTFALSNIGSIGTGIGANPILLPPQVCIGVLCRMHQELVPNLTKIAHNGKYVADDHVSSKIATIMTVHWSADHRLIDGATLARFSLRWKTLVENPMLLLLDLS
jgi:2-oxoisovalerate dehydrogenase E2 component (dihydrolipoyl transacylase)